MNHPWSSLILSLADALDQAQIPYSFEAATAILIQGLEMPGMDDIDLAVQWLDLERVHTLFAADHPAPITWHEGWAVFRFEREGVPVDILSYRETRFAADPDRLAVPWNGRLLWCKSIAFFHRHARPESLRRRLIEEFWGTQA